MPNAELLWRTLEYIETHPGEWNQKYWRCRTSMCFAGIACELSGAQWIQKDPEYFREGFVPRRGSRGGIGLVVVGPLGFEVVDNYAAKVLGLTSDQAVCLFSSMNTLENLREWVEEFAGPCDEASAEFNAVADEAGKEVERVAV